MDSTEGKPRIAFQVVVYENGQMEYTMQSLGQPAIDELILRGWLDKVREGVLEAAKKRAGLISI